MKDKENKEVFIPEKPHIKIKSKDLEILKESSEINAEIR